MIAAEDYLYFAERAVAGMASIVTELGDDGANGRAYEGANTPYALLHHCLAVVETWAGGFVHGRAVDRDRAAEFMAAGPVGPLVSRATAVVEQLRVDVLTASPEASLAQQPPADFLGPDRPLTQAGALQHVFEELAQHHGQMEILRDVLVRGRAPQELS
jgi:cystathionine beta-lyase